MIKMKNSKTTLRSLDDLHHAGLLDQITHALEQVTGQFAVSVTPAMAAQITAHTPNDPVAKQFIPSADELVVHPDELADPIADAKFSPVPGITHRYPDRALLKPLHACPVYCRFCFRREQVGPDQGLLSPEQLAQAMNYIRQHTELWEIILSGGDPLMLSDRRLGAIIAELNTIRHVKVIRIHTRVPVVDPERITPALVQALRAATPVYMLIHSNHPQEWSDASRKAVALLADSGIPLLSQSVLLNGVNDDPAILADLMRLFIENRIKPHYLHHPDLARGTSHFRIPLARAIDIVRQMRGRLSGLCQPTYILDIPGGHGKVPVNLDFTERTKNGWIIVDHQGNRHDYSNIRQTSLPEQANSV